MNRWKDWYEQGKRDLQRALLALEHEYYEWVCFTSQQAAEKIVKALGLRFGITPLGHSLTEMFALLQECLEIPREIGDQARFLDLYYIPPRYPNGFAAGKPADYFTEKEARDAVDAAVAILRFCESHFAEQG